MTSRSFLLAIRRDTSEPPLRAFLAGSGRRFERLVLGQPNEACFAQAANCLATHDYFLDRLVLLQTPRVARVPRLARFNGAVHLLRDVWGEWGDPLLKQITDQFCRVLSIRCLDNGPSVLFRKLVA